MFSHTKSSIDTCSGTAEYLRALRAFADRNISATLEYLGRAEAIGYDPNECSALRWHCWMLLGRFDDAWRESGRINARGVSDPNRLWDELPFTGKRVIIRCLHGYGDAIQFLRYARLVRADAKRVIVETHPEMVSLLRGIAGVDEVITWADGIPAPEWDQQIEVMELPRAFLTTVETIPAEIPYLYVCADRQARSRAVLGTRRKPRVGLLWSSSDWNPARSMRLSDLLPILELPFFSFYSFQRGAARNELREIRLPIHDTAGHSPEIADTAADLMHMDLLITVDTMVAHLAGALRKAVWVLLPHAADWRWMLDRDDTPWYPTMRLFRQTAPGDWQTPVRRILRLLIGSHPLVYPR